MAMMGFRGCSPGVSLSTEGHHRLNEINLLRKIQYESIFKVKSMLNYLFKKANPKFVLLSIITGLVELHSICSPGAYKIVIWL